MNKDYILIPIKTENCSVCNAKIIEPNYYNQFQRNYIEKEGIKFKANINIQNKKVCEDCYKQDKVDFKCYLCECKKPISKIKEQFGDPADLLCLDCFSSVTAKKWDDIITELEEMHKWDFQ